MEIFLAVTFFIAGLCQSGLDALYMFIISALFTIADAIRNHK